MKVKKHKRRQQTIQTTIPQANQTNKIAVRCIKLQRVTHSQS